MLIEFLLTNVLLLVFLQSLAKNLTEYNFSRGKQINIYFMNTKKLFLILNINKRKKKTNHISPVVPKL